MLSPSELHTYLLTLKENSPHSSYWNISWKLGEHLKQFVQDHHPKRVLEIGTSNGFSTLWIVQGAPQSHITTIEVDEGRANEAQHHFETVGCADRIELLRGEVFEILENHTFEPFDVIFLDAAHRKYTEVVRRLEELGLITWNTLLIADNVISHSYMNTFVDWMQERYDCSIIDVDSGFLVGKRK